MKIIENPKTKLDSVDLIDENGVLLRITPNSLLELSYKKFPIKEHTQDFCAAFGYRLPNGISELSLIVEYFGQTLLLQFKGDKADRIAESLYKLKGY